MVLPVANGSSFPLTPEQQAVRVAPWDTVFALLPQAERVVTVYLIKIAAV